MPENAPSPPYSVIYAFGDSLSDSGNISIFSSKSGLPFPASPPYFSQQYGSASGAVFSNGPTWVQDLSLALGLGTLAPSLTGGTNFAYGGAETGATPQDPNNKAVQAISLQAQLTQFKLAEPNPPANALYTISIGANDLNDILATGGLTAEQQAADVQASVANEIDFIKQLAANGATNLLVLNMPDLGRTPNVISGRVNGTTGSAALTAEASQLSSQYNAALISQLGTIAGLNAHVIDAYGLINAAVANPAVYGLTNTTTPVWSGNYTDANSGTVVTPDAAAQNQYLFWDQLHPTETGHQFIADAGVQLLTGVAPLTVTNMTAGQPVAASGQPYTGPAPDLQRQYIAITADNLNISASTPGWFIHGGAGMDAIAVTSGTNVLDGGGGSNFLTGGSGADTFFVSADAAAMTWSTINNFQAGDGMILFGITPGDFGLSWADGLGAAGYTGLTLTATQAGQPETLLTFAGYSSAALSNGTLSVSAGTQPDGGSAFVFVRAIA
ncbi:MAG: SGNH/GDSL hydrolase family protein [Acetobacteraceae bacterium]